MIGSFRWISKFIYRETEKNQIMVKETPSKDSIEKLWKGIRGELKARKMSASWIENTKKGNEKVKEK